MTNRAQRSAAAAFLLLVTVLLWPAAAPALAQNYSAAPGWNAELGMPAGEKEREPEQSADEEQSQPDPGASTEETGETTSAEPISEETPTEEGEETGGLAGMVLGWFKDILKFVYDATVGDTLEKISGALKAGILGLPDPSGEVVELYEDLAEKMRPAILVGVLIVGLLMMLRTSSYDLAYAGFHALPRLLGVGIALAFLPDFMGMLSDLAYGVSGAFFPSGSQIRGAQMELFEAALSNLVATNFLNVVLAVLYCLAGFAVILVAFLKNILFVLLFIAGPFALIGSVIPGLSHLAGSWFRGVLACAAIPSLWAVEVGIGTVIVRSPEVIFGEAANALGFWSDGITTSIGAILVLYVMYKTPFKVLEWAFQSYDASSGPWRGLARSVAVGVAATGVRSGLKAFFAGGTATTGEGAASGGAGSAGGPAVAGRASSSGATPGLPGRNARQIGAGDRGRSAGQRELPPPPRALPPAPPEVVERFLKSEDATPGFKKPWGRDRGGLTGGRVHDRE